MTPPSRIQLHDTRCCQNAPRIGDHGIAMTTATTLQKTLPARYYTDPEVFRQELERFFCSMWFCSGRTEQLQKPGDFYLCEVAGESIIVTRDANGAIRAFYNVCRHRGTRMCTETAGSFAGRIQCPYHGWTYGLDGKLIGAPHMEQEGFRREEYPLHSVRVEEWGGFIFLSLDRNALSSQRAACGFARQVCSVEHAGPALV